MKIAGLVVIGLLPFDLSDTRQEFQGFGVHTWATMDWGSWDDMRRLRAETDQLGIKWLYNLWSAPRGVTERGLLTDIPGFAAHWRWLVETLDSEGTRPHLIDLMNEPDSYGGWSTGIEPAEYTALVKATRAELDAAGFEDVGIAGPGLTHLNWNEGNARWFGRRGFSSHRATGAHWWPSTCRCTSAWPFPTSTVPSTTRSIPTC